MESKEPSSSASSLEQGVTLLTDLHITSRELLEQAAGQGKHLTYTQLFEQALIRMNCSKDDLLTLSDTIEHALRAIQKLG